MKKSVRELRERHQSLANLRAVTATLMADDMVDARGLTAYMIKTYVDLRDAERRCHNELMEALHEQAREANRRAAGA